MARPLIGNYGSFYQTYIDYTTESTVAELIETYTQPLNNFIQNLPEHKANFAYANGKWTVKQVLQHIIDTERIFSYRALSIARADATPLPGFNENNYANNGTATHRTLQQLKHEFVAVRHSTNFLLQSFTPTQLEQIGTASNQPITCNALCFIVFGHVLHHQRILQERYLS